jgi:hypothetical protein
MEWEPTPKGQPAGWGGLGMGVRKGSEGGGERGRDPGGGD